MPFVHSQKLILRIHLLSLLSLGHLQRLKYFFVPIEVKMPGQEVHNFLMLCKELPGSTQDERKNRTSPNDNLWSPLQFLSSPCLRHHSAALIHLRLQIHLQKNRQAQAIRMYFSLPVSTHSNTNNL